MFSSVARRLLMVALVCGSAAACHHDDSSSVPTPAPASSVKVAASLPANPAVLAAQQSPAPASSILPPRTIKWKGDEGEDPAQTAREGVVANELVKKYPRLTIQRMDEVPTGGEPVYYIMASGQLFYTNAHVDYLVQGGQLIIGVGDNVRNVTEQMQQSLAAAIYAKLPLEQAVKHTYGKGERQLVMFSDPDCPICQAFERNLEAKGAALNATVYTFPLPLLALHPDSVLKATYLLCTPDPGAAWHDWMIHADTGWAAWTAKHKSAVGCKRAELAAVGSKLAQSLGLTRTPSLMFKSGTIIPGAPTLEQMEAIWALPDPPKL